MRGVLASRARASARPTRRATSRAMPALVALDRDGVINADVGAPGVIDVERLVLLPGAARAVRALNDAGVRTCVCTNQTCVGKGYVTERYLVETVHGRLRELLRAEAGAELGEIYYATKTKDVACERRKPAGGMVLEALAAAGVRGEECVFVGDTVTDMQAAARAGVRRALVCTGYGNIMGDALRERNVKLPTTIAMRADDPTLSFPDECFPFDVYEDLSHFVSCILDV